MSKNVAVFVDVANIFYAAKAAGVDIDYVTLLKAASAGRDLVRAYAYTGLDPENENQRQFHAFLARNGYRVVSKDIRKYGDGKVKANLDIELVVDLMRTSRNLDIAVVVSGDGDFAPAIRAVQQTGVRVEVISFRGNTSSDLIDVADVFTDITQIARVERSSRSGRRVAAEDGDLSMTEVPEKETEGASRRRWGRRGEGREEARRDERHPERRERQPLAAAAAVMATTPSGMPLVVLPGEKLSKAATVALPASGEEILAAEEAEETAELAEVGSAQSAGPESQGQETGRRRRRRRGGRGRGRGRGQEAVSEAANVAAPGLLDEEGEGEEELEPEAPRIPPHSAFGSVWDSQLGMPTAPAAGTAELDEEELEEPEIPEYLLTERRQRGRATRTPRGTRGGRGSAYQQAVERERFGRGAADSLSSGGRAPRTERSPERSARPQFERQERARLPREPQPEPRPQGGAEPWSEVPPDVAELLRAELARRGGAAQEEVERVQAPSAAAALDGSTQPPKAARAPEGTRGRGRARSVESAQAPSAVRAELAAATEPGSEPSTAGRGESGVSAATPPTLATAPRGRRRSGRGATGETLQVAGADVAATAGALGGTEGAEAKPATARRRGRTGAPSAATGMSGATDESAATQPAGGSAATQPVAAERPRGRRTGRSSAESTSAETVGTDTAAATAGEPPTVRRRTPRATAGRASESSAEAAQRAAEGDEPASPPRRRTRRTTPASES